MSRPWHLSKILYRVSLLFKLTVRSYVTLPQTINHVWLVNTFFKLDQSQTAKETSQSIDINICAYDSPNTMMCTNSQTLCTGSLEYLQCRLKNSNKILHLVSRVHQYFDRRKRNGNLIFIFIGEKSKTNTEE